MKWFHLSWRHLYRHGSFFMILWQIINITWTEKSDNHGVKSKDGLQVVLKGGKACHRRCLSWLSWPSSLSLALSFWKWEGAEIKSFGFTIYRREAYRAVSAQDAALFSLACLWSRRTCRCRWAGRRSLQIRPAAIVSHPLPIVDITGWNWLHNRQRPGFPHARSIQIRRDLSSFDDPWCADWSFPIPGGSCRCTSAVHEAAAYWPALADDPGHGAQDIWSMRPVCSSPYMAWAHSFDISFWFICLYLLHLSFLTIRSQPCFSLWIMQPS